VDELWRIQLASRHHDQANQIRQHPGSRPNRALNFYTDRCDDIDKTYEELKKRGVEFEGPPQKQPWGTYAMFKDSEGNSFVLSAD